MWKATEFGPQFDPHRCRIGRQRNLKGQRAVEPGEEVHGLVGIESRFLDRDESIALSGEHSPKPTIRSDADEGLAGLIFAVAKVVGHLALDVRPISDQVLLGLENGPTDQSVCAALDLDASFEANVGEWDIELRDQELSKIGLDLVMARLACQVAKDFQ